MGAWAELRKSAEVETIPAPPPATRGKAESHHFPAIGHKAKVAATPNPESNLFYHGTHADAVPSIRAVGFRPSEDGTAGRGVYLTRDPDRAASLYERAAHAAGVVAHDGAQPDTHLQVPVHAKLYDAGVHDSRGGPSVYIKPHVLAAHKLLGGDGIMGGPELREAMADPHKVLREHGYGGVEWRFRDGRHAAVVFDPNDVDHRNMKVVRGPGEPAPAPAAPKPVALDDDQRDLLDAMQRASLYGDHKQLAALREMAPSYDLTEEHITQALGAADRDRGDLDRQNDYDRLDQLEQSPSAAIFPHVGPDGNLKKRHPYTGKPLRARTRQSVVSNARGGRFTADHDAVWHLPGSGYDELADEALASRHGNMRDTSADPPLDEFYTNALRDWKERRDIRQRLGLGKSGGRFWAAGRPLLKADTVDAAWEREQQRNAARTTPRQWTPEERAANLADWHRDSKIVNPDGTPKVVYHGTSTPKHFDSFKVGTRGQFGRGVYFTDDPDYAASFAGGGGDETKGDSPRIVPAHLRIRNPYVWGSAPHIEALPEKMRDREIRRLHDGIVVPPSRPGLPTQYAAFHPHQIKSAIGNDGTYHDSDPRLTKSAREAGLHDALKAPWHMTDAEYRAQARTHDQMVADGADGHLDRATLAAIPLRHITGLEPRPSNEEGRPGRPINQPVEARWQASLGKFILYAGNHRYHQAVANGQTHIPAYVAGLAGPFHARRVGKQLGEMADEVRKSDGWRGAAAGALAKAERRAARTFTDAEARRLGDTIGVDWGKVDLEQFRRGLAVEMEHGGGDPQTDVTGGDPAKTARIALAHLKELPDYYTRLAKMEKSGDHWRGEPRDQKGRWSKVAFAPSIGIRSALDAIRAAGGKTYVVGGYPRDLLLGGAPKDYDFETFKLAPEALDAALSGVGKVDAVGRSFGVSKVRTPQGDDLDFALPRTEKKTGAGHRGFVTEADPHLSPQAASARRDYTINALMLDPDTGEIIDHHGGIADLQAKVLRHVGPAFAEDPLRVLRGMQFAARYGFTLAPETVALARDLAPEYHSLSKERVWGEWEKWAQKGAHPARGIQALEQTGWLAHFPELAALRGVPQDPTHHPEGDALTHTMHVCDAMARICTRDHITGDDRTVAMLAALCHDLGKAVPGITVHEGDGRITSRGHDAAGVEPTMALLDQIGCPLGLRAKIAVLVREHMARNEGAANARVVRRLAARLAPHATVADWDRVVEADVSGRPPRPAARPGADWVRMAQELGADEGKPKPIVGGKALIARGYKPGVEFSPILGAAYDAQLDGALDADNADDWLDKYLAQRPTRKGWRGGDLTKARRRPEPDYGHWEAGEWSPGPAPDPTPPAGTDGLPLVAGHILKDGSAPRHGDNSFGDIDLTKRFAAQDATIDRMAGALKDDPDFAGYAARHHGGDVTKAVRAMKGAWMGSSTPEFGSLHRAAAEHFGIDGPRRTFPQGELPEADHPAAAAYLRHAHRLTQADLAQHGLSTVRLWRGVNPANADKPAAPLTAWSAQRNVAAQYAGDHHRGIVEQADVPAHQIVATPRSGLGDYTSAEYVVARGARPPTIKGWRGAAATGAK